MNGDGVRRTRARPYMGPDGCRRSDKAERE